MKPQNWFDFLFGKKKSISTSNTNVIADQMEAIVHEAYFHYPNPDPEPFEYAILHNSQKHVGWFIVIYFENGQHLRLALENGLCYRYYEFLSKGFRKRETIAHLSKYILFDVGRRPIGDAAATNAIEKLIPKIESMGTIAQVPKMGICRCGHPFDIHQHHRNSEPFPSSLTKGWITCSADDCNCFII